MDRNDVNWRGYWAACPTPFGADGSYDADAHRALLDWYIGEGLHGVLINGTTTLVPAPPWGGFTVPSAPNGYRVALRRSRIGIKFSRAAC